MKNEQIKIIEEIVFNVNDKGTTKDKRILLKYLEQKYKIQKELISIIDIYNKKEFGL